MGLCNSDHWSVLCKNKIKIIFMLGKLQFLFQHMGLFLFDIMLDTFLSFFLSLLKKSFCDTEYATN